MGTVELSMATLNNINVRVRIKNCIYSPSTPANLLTTKGLLDNGMAWDMRTNQITAHGKVTIQCKWVNSLPVLPVYAQQDFPQDTRHAMMASINYSTMHRRLMHAGRDQVLKACEAAGIKLSNTQEHFCEACVKAKAHDVIPKIANKTTTQPMAYIHVDVVSHTLPGHKGYKYMIHFIDEVTGFHWARFMVNKGDAFIQIKEFKKWAELQSGGLKIRAFGLDGGPEFGFSTKEFQRSKLVDWARTEGVELLKSTPHTPWMQGKIERAGAIIMQRARALMIDLGIPEHLWPFVVDHVVRVLNLLPSKACNDRSPWELLAEAANFPDEIKKPYIKHLRSYFCTAYYFIKPERRPKADKFRAKAQKGYFIGFDDLHGRIVFIWNPHTGEIVRASAVTFLEEDPVNQKDPVRDSNGNIVEHHVIFSDQTVDEINTVAESGYQIWVKVDGKVPQPHSQQPQKALEPSPQHVAKKPWETTITLPLSPETTPAPAVTPVPSTAPVPQNAPVLPAQPPVAPDPQSSPDPQDPLATQSAPDSPPRLETSVSQSPSPVSESPAAVTSPTRSSPDPPQQSESPGVIDSIEDDDLLDLEDLDEEDPRPRDRRDSSDGDNELTVYTAPGTPLPSTLQQPASAARLPPIGTPNPNRIRQYTPSLNTRVSKLQLQPSTPLQTQSSTQQPAQAQPAQGSQPSESDAHASHPEVSEGRPRRSTAKPADYKYGLQKVKDSMGNTIQESVTLPNNFHNTTEGRLVRRDHVYCLTAVKVNHDMLCLTAAKAQRFIPKNYRQARKQANFEIYWLPAMKKQVQALEDRGVYTLVPRTSDVDVLPGKWVYDEKLDIDTKDWRARARWVVCGNYEQDNWAVQDIYAAVAHSVSVRLFLAIMALNNYECYQFDFDTAFLNAPIPDNTQYYVEQPTALEKPILGYSKEDVVCQLTKALYGLKRSPLYWFETLLPVLKDTGFVPVSADSCLLTNRALGALLVLYVDDLLVAAPTAAIVNRVKEQLASHFKLKELGEVRTFLGYDIVRDRQTRTVFISQQRYTMSVIAKFNDGKTKLHGVKTPWPPDSKVYGGVEVSADEAKSYPKKTGSLNWLSMSTRPDISYTVSKLSEANKNPTDRHLFVMKHLWRYLSEYTDLGIVLGGMLSPSMAPSFHACADASFADDIPTRKSTAGHIVFFTCGPILWKSKKQDLVTTSTTEAEFTNLVPTAKALDWVCGMLDDLNVDLGLHKVNRILYTDSSNAKNRVLNPKMPTRNRYIDIRYKWLIQEVMDRKAFTIEHLPGEEMPADGLTKPLKPDKHAKFVKLVGMVQKKVPWA